MKYPVYKPYLKENTKIYVNECIDSTWISSKGKFVNIFEENIAAYCNIQYASSVFNGTVALHLALLALEIGEGDEVIVPDFTYIATANAVKYVGAKPILVDVSIDDWNITLEEIKKVYNNKVKAIIVVDMYGTQPKELKEISDFAKENGIYVIQDSAESIGSRYYGHNIGEYADVATLSFFGNKTITTGEGGMVLTNNKSIHEKVEILKNQGNSKSIRYFHDMLGYNYRMTNIQAAIGCSQLEIIDEILERKLLIFNLYKELLEGVVEFQKTDDDRISSNWLVSVVLKDMSEEIFHSLNDVGIETRPFFQPISSMPFYETCDNPITYHLAQKGLSLPSYPELEKDDIRFICNKIKESVGKL